LETVRLIDFGGIDSPDCICPPGGDVASRFGHHPWTVQELVIGVDKGTIRLPDIQRPFVWPNAKVRDLIDSMHRGYPVGELMFWTKNDHEHTKAIGHAVKTQAVSYQVVDGQQRLTSLYSVLKGLPVWREDYSREKIAIAFNPLTERFEVPTPAFKKSAEWIPDIVGVFASPIQARRDYLDRLRKDPNRTVDAALEDRVEVAITRLNQLQTYQFQVVQINEEVSRETVADIFVRINSEGVALSSADFILTWMSVFWEDGRSQLETWPEIPGSPQARLPRSSTRRRRGRRTTRTYRSTPATFCASPWPLGCAARNSPTPTTCSAVATPEPA
jgi:hypothetical protein